MGLLDEARNIREGEELDAGKVGEFLKSTVGGLSGDVRIRQFPKGFSNLTYLLSVGEDEFVLRRPPFGKKAKTAHDMSREYRMLSALKPHFPYCPTPLAYSEDSSVMDCSFYIMERIRGIIPRENMPKGLELTPDQARKLSEKLVEVWCELHAIDYQAIGLEDYGRPEGYVKRQVEGWSRRYRDARTDDAPDCEQVMQWLHDHMPPDTENPAVIHNDYKFDNVVLDPDDPMKIIGVLDWEMATIGDPLMDLGSSLAYWIQADDPQNLQMMRRLPTNLAGMPSRRELAELYQEMSGRKVTHYEFYFCFGLFRLGVIAQQIYYRYYHGQTKDPRFAMLVYGVKMLEEKALSVMSGLGH